MEHKATAGSNNSGFQADGVLNKATSGAHAALDKVADDAAKKAKPAIEKVAGFAHQAIDNAAGVAAPAADWLSEQGQDLKARQDKIMGATADYTKAHPWKSVGIALVAGILISRITH